MIFEILERTLAIIKEQYNDIIPDVMKPLLETMQSLVDNEELAKSENPLDENGLKAMNAALLKIKAESDKVLFSAELSDDSIVRTALNCMSIPLDGTIEEIGKAQIGTVKAKEIGRDGDWVTKMFGIPEEIPEVPIDLTVFDGKNLQSDMDQYKSEIKALPDVLNQHLQNVSKEKENSLFAFKFKCDLMQAALNTYKEGFHNPVLNFNNAKRAADALTEKLDLEKIESPDDIIRKDFMDRYTDLSSAALKSIIDKLTGIKPGTADKYKSVFNSLEIKPRFMGISKEKMTRLDKISVSITSVSLALKNMCGDAEMRNENPANPDDPLHDAYTKGNALNEKLLAYLRNDKGALVPSLDDFREFTNALSRHALNYEFFSYDPYTFSYYASSATEAKELFHMLSVSVPGLKQDYEAFSKNFQKRIDSEFNTLLSRYVSAKPGSADDEIYAKMNVLSKSGHSTNSEYERMEYLRMLRDPQFLEERIANAKKALENNEKKMLVSGYEINNELTGQPKTQDEMRATIFKDLMIASVIKKERESGKNPYITVAVKGAPLNPTQLKNALTYIDSLIGSKELNEVSRTDAETVNQISKDASFAEQMREMVYAEKALSKIPVATRKAFTGSWSRDADVTQIKKAITELQKKSILPGADALGETLNLYNACRNYCKKHTSVKNTLYEEAYKMMDILSYSLEQRIPEYSEILKSEVLMAKYKGTGGLNAIENQIAENFTKMQSGKITRRNIASMIAHQQVKFALTSGKIDFYEAGADILSESNIKKIMNDPKLNTIVKLLELNGTGNQPQKLASEITNAYSMLTKGSEDLIDYVNVKLAEQKREWLKKREALMPGIEDSTVQSLPRYLGLTVNRTALDTLNACILMQKGYAIQDIFDSTKLLEEKAEGAKEVLATYNKYTGQNPQDLKALAEFCVINYSKGMKLMETEINKKAAEFSEFTGRELCKPENSYLYTMMFTFNDAKQELEHEEIQVHAKRILGEDENSRLLHRANGVVNIVKDIIQGETVAKEMLIGKKRVDYESFRIQYTSGKITENIVNNLIKTECKGNGRNLCDIISADTTNFNKARSGSAFYGSKQDEKLESYIKNAKDRNKACADIIKGDLFSGDIKFVNNPFGTMDPLVENFDVKLQHIKDLNDANRDKFIADGKKMIEKDTAYLKKYLNGGKLDTAAQYLAKITYQKQIFNHETLLSLDDMKVATSSEQIKAATISFKNSAKTYLETKGKTALTNAAKDNIKLKELLTEFGNTIKDPATKSERTKNKVL